MRSENDLNPKNLINVYWSLKKGEKEVMKRIRKSARNMKKATLLMTMPGIGEYSALLFEIEVHVWFRFFR